MITKRKLIVTITFLYVVFLLINRQYYDPIKLHPHYSNCINHFKTTHVIPDYDTEKLPYIKEQVRSIRAYSQCFLNYEIPCDVQVESKLFPWLTHESPIITTTNGSKKLFDIKGCLFGSIKKQISGKGIVLTASNFHFKELLNLVLLLRSLKVDIPIQIIHNDEIESFSQESIFKMSQFDLSSNSNITKLLDIQQDLPRLDVSFVNISNVIKQPFKQRFRKFSNKLLAYTFNSFQEVVLIDVDTIPLQKLQDFFQFEEYIKKGAFFFKDRSLPNGHDSSLSFLSLMPNDNDFHEFGIPLISTFTTKNHFFKKFKHLMESGVVIVDRSRHFTNSIMATSLGLFNMLVENVWGEKELYWLAMSIMGDESYHFNTNFAVSIGEISKGSKSHYQNYEGSELCSSHPGHLYKTKLLWFNSGFSYCKKTMIDETNPFFHGLSTDEIIKFNKSPFKIRHALKPPVPEKPGLLSLGDDQIPKRNWIPRDYCEAYTVCAYDVVDGFQEKGQVIEFEESEWRRYDYLGKVWNSGMEVMALINKKH